MSNADGQRLLPLKAMNALSRCTPIGAEIESSQDGHLAWVVVVPLITSHGPGSEYRMSHACHVNEHRHVPYYVVPEIRRYWVLRLEVVESAIPRLDDDDLHPGELHGITTYAVTPEQLAEAVAIWSDDFDGFRHVANVPGLSTVMSRLTTHIADRFPIIEH